MLSCREATRLMSDQQERILSTRERLELQVHVMMCKGCKNFKLQMPFLRRAMRAYSERVDAVLAETEPPAQQPHTGDVPPPKAP